jgi:putative hemolysin
MLLWKGIGAFVAANPRYRILFGPVSISNEYASLSQQLLVELLRHNSDLPDLARMVRPRRPFRGGGRPLPEYAQVRDIEALSELIAQIEGDAKGAPILLKQYLKLGGRLLGFNVDRAFSDAVDGLIMVDLLETEPKVLQRYMGPEQAERFLAYHRPPSGEPASLPLAKRNQ